MRCSMMLGGQLHRSDLPALLEIINEVGVTNWADTPVRPDCENNLKALHRLEGDPPRTLLYMRRHGCSYEIFRPLEDFAWSHSLAYRVVTLGDCGVGSVKCFRGNRSVGILTASCDDNERLVVTEGKLAELRETLRAAAAMASIADAAGHGYNTSQVLSTLARHAHMGLEEVMPDVFAALPAFEIVD